MVDSDALVLSADVALEDSDALAEGDILNKSLKETVPLMDGDKLLEELDESASLPEADGDDETLSVADTGGDGDADADEVTELLAVGLVLCVADVLELPDGDGVTLAAAYGHGDTGSSWQHTLKGYVPEHGESLASVLNT